MTKKSFCLLRVQFLMLAEPCELQEAVKFYDLGCEAGPDSISRMERGLQK